MGAVDQSGQMVSLTSNNSVPWLRKRECDTQGRLQSVKECWESLTHFLSRSHSLAAMESMGIGSDSGQRYRSERRIGGRKTSSVLRGIMHQPYVSHLVNGFPSLLRFYREDI